MLKLTQTITCEIDNGRLQDIARDIYEVMETNGEPITVDNVMSNIDYICLDLETTECNEVPSWVLGTRNNELLAEALIPYLHAFKLLDSKE